MATQVGEKYGFSPDAIKVLQLSSFCLDYFGPFLTEAVSFVEKNVSYLELKNLPSTGEAHAASNFIHFDNIAGGLDRNWKFDYLWSRLLDNTKQTVSSYYANSKLNPDERKRLILLALGSSIHMVEDFYSHSDWIHHNFVKMGYPQQELRPGEPRSPTWFEVRKRLGVPSAKHLKENWKFQVCTGIFPPPTDAPVSPEGVPLSHTTMNHDNSQLYYNGASQIKYHAFGPFPATDSASAVTHQLYCIHSATAAAMEWMALLEKDPDVKTAIDFARTWSTANTDRVVADDLKDGLYSSLMVSCVVKKWDGNFPPPDRDKDCGTMKLLSHMHVPTMGNVFFGAFAKDSVLQKLTTGFGDSTGHYTFDSLWVGKHPMQRD